ncbi:MAG: DUF3995 domain-containing protein [Leptospiraceae bacterium]|nr:DUF3995 domain-containing protein [Leptospiraceae bacterium]
MLISSMAGWFLVLVFSIIAFMHVYWAAGGRRGLTAVIPAGPDGRPVFQPGILITLLVALVFVIGAVSCALLLAYPGLRSIKLSFITPAIILYATSAVFFMRAVGNFKNVGFGKRLRGTRFARMDDLLFSPLCVCIGLALVLFA